MIHEKKRERNKRYSLWTRTSGWKALVERFPFGVFVNDDDDEDEGEEDDWTPGDGTTGGSTTLTLARVGEFLWIAFTEK